MLSIYFYIKIEFFLKNTEYRPGFRVFKYVYLIPVLVGAESESTFGKPSFLFSAGD
jgi:hypothetical protein